MLVTAGQVESRRDVQLLLEHILHTDRATLYTYPERALSEAQEQQFRQLLERRTQNEPLAYLIGHQEFYGLDFLVDRRVLIPRPETELLVESALGLLREKLDAGQNTGQTPLVADIGTGSGAIPITLAVEEPRLPLLYAADISPDALEVAQLNCQRHGVEARVRLLQGDLLAPLLEPVDLLTANLPYVGTDEIGILPPDVYNYEPHLALFSGPQGLNLLHRFLLETQQRHMLKAQGAMLLEVGYQQQERLAQFLHELWPGATVTSKKDYVGWDRVILMQV